MANSNNLEKISTTNSNTCLINRFAAVMGKDPSEVSLAINNSLKNEEAWVCQGTPPIEKSADPFKSKKLSKYSFAFAVTSHIAETLEIKSKDAQHYMLEAMIGKNAQDGNGPLTVCGNPIMSQ